MAIVVTFWVLLVALIKIIHICNGVFTRSLSLDLEFLLSPKPLHYFTNLYFLPESGLWCLVFFVTINNVTTFTALLFTMKIPFRCVKRVWQLILIYTCSTFYVSFDWMAAIIKGLMNNLKLETAVRLIDVKDGNMNTGSSISFWSLCIPIIFLWNYSCTQKNRFKRNTTEKNLRLAGSTTIHHLWYLLVK